MSQLSDYAENLLANFLANNQTATRPTAWHVGLFTVAPSDAGGGTEVSTTSTGYSRQAFTFGAASGGQVANTNSGSFGPASASWGTVSHFGVFDAPTGGNLLWWGSLTTSRTIASGESATFAVGAFTLTLA